LKSNLIEVPDAKAIEQAHDRIRNYIHKTPVLSSKYINDIFSANIYFKCENFQKVGAFKSRGAVNAVMSLSEDQLKYGVCTHSSGNHAQALARAAKIRNTKAYIVMPKTAQKVKIAAVKHYGGEITFCEPTLAAREEAIQQLMDKTSAVNIHPYNNVIIIAGQATAAKELIGQQKNLDIIMAPVGGGGLISGTALSAKYFSPNTKVIAGEPDNANDAYHSFYKKEIIPSVNPITIADGLLTSLGSITFPIILENVSQIVTASESAIIEAMKLVWDRMKIIIEPSSAVPLATLLENKFDFKNKEVGIILSGGNVDLANLPWK